MSAINLTVGEVLAIDTACIALQELRRRGRLYESECADAGDHGGVEWYAASVQRVEQALEALRALRDRLQEGNQ